MINVAECVAAIKNGTVSREQAAENALSRAKNDGFGAWATLDAHAPQRLAPNQNTAPLAGVAVGVKDLFRVAHLPMRVGTPLSPALPSGEDAALVAMLRQAGAAIIGTTSMPEFSLGITPGAKNPRNALHTPGSSSSGCAIAVAAGQVPVTLAMQTNASIIRPASFCGVAAFKPTQGVLPLDGAYTLAPGLDQPGFMAAGLDDLTAVFEALVPAQETPVPRGKLAFMRTPVWNQASPTSRKKLEFLARSLGAEDIFLPEELSGVWQWLDCIMETELAESLAVFRDREGEMKPPMQRALIRGRGYADQTRKAAEEGRAALRSWGRQCLSGFDCIITPAATGPAPLLEEGAGSPIFSTIWSLMGAPCLCLPAFEENGLPVGVQLVAAPGKDALLLQAARHAEAALLDERQ